MIIFFLTVWGTEADLPFSASRKELSLFKPIFKKLKKKFRKMQKNGFRVITILEERKKIFLNFSKEKKTGSYKTFFFEKK